MILRLKKKLINSISLLQWSSYGRFALKSNKNSTLSFIETKSPRIFHILLLYLQIKFYQNISKGKEKKEKTNKTYTNVKSNARKDGQTDRQTDTRTQRSLALEESANFFKSVVTVEGERIAAFGNEATRGKKDRGRRKSKGGT